MSLTELAASLPDHAEDLRLNLAALLADESLGERCKYGLILASAHGTGYKPIVAAAEAEAADRLDEAHAHAARAAAALMAMNNVYYRFVHLASNPVYRTLPAKLRMSCLGMTGIDKVEFELFSLAVSAQNGCGMCIDAHEKVLAQHGVKAETIQTAVKFAAVIKALATVHATM